MPSSISELKEGWCCGTPKLTKVTIIPTGLQNFFYNDNGLIVGKTDSKSDEFDILVFARRDLKKVTFPSNIKRVASYAFAQSEIEYIFTSPHLEKISESAFFSCQHLKNFDIPENSELRAIGKHAFSESSLERIFIPPRCSVLRFLPNHSSERSDPMLSLILQLFTCSFRLALQRFVRILFIRARV